MSAPRIEIHVEALVLHGFPPLDRQAVADAVRAELTRLVDREGIASVAAAAELDGGQLELATVTPQTLGPEIAQVVHGALRP